MIDQGHLERKIIFLTQFFLPMITAIQQVDMSALMCRPLINLIISSWHQQAFSQHWSFLHEWTHPETSFIPRDEFHLGVWLFASLCLHDPEDARGNLFRTNLFSTMIIQHLKKYPIYSYHTTRTNISSNRTHANQWQYHRQYYTSYNNILTFFNIPSRDASLDACPDTSSIASVWSNASILFRSPSVSGSSSVKW